MGWVKQFHKFSLFMWIAAALMLVGCDVFTQVEPTPTPITISKALATVFVSPTPNPDEIAATNAFITPTPITPTPTIQPTETPYIGEFLGEAVRDTGMQRFAEPIFAEPVVDDNAPRATRCNVTMNENFVPIWEANSAIRQRLGCPIQASFGFFAEFQLFESGVMYHDPEINAVWAIVPVANRARYDYLENPPETAVVGAAPPNFVTPTGVFGNMWAVVPGLQDEMGFAVTEAQEISMAAQRFEQGTFLWDQSSEQIYALTNDGTVYGPFLAPDLPDEAPDPDQPIQIDPDQPIPIEAATPTS